MASVNKVILIGRLGRDPELRYTRDGTPVCNMSLATDESFTASDGSKVERVEWHSVILFNRNAENAKTYLGKGSLVYIEGSLQTRKWQDKDGQDRYTTEIKALRMQFLDRKGAAQGRADGASEHEPEDQGPAFPSEAGGMSDVPF